MIKLSDYVVKFLESKGVKDIFLISGGGMMHLLDSVGQSRKINLYCNLNEQATTICGDAYAQFTNDLSVCMVTTGPGATNAVTGVVSAYIDSTPMLVISGQVKTADIVGDRGVRQIGAQECDIVTMVKSQTKYAAVVTKKEDIRFHLEKAVYLATHGRRGTVWIDIPLDIQAAMIDEESLYGFSPDKEPEFVGSVKENEIKLVYELLNASKRPVILAGHGVIASGAAVAFKALADKLSIPVLTTWRAKNLFDDDNSIYFGHPGSPGPRYSNYVLQNSDFMLIVGTRLNVGVTAFNDRNFGKNAKKVIVDIDENEIKKLDMDFEENIICDARIFMEKMLDCKQLYNAAERNDWISYCRRMKDKYPMSQSITARADGLVDGYELAYEISKRSKRDDLAVMASSGRSCGIMNLGFERHGQTIVNAMGLGSMGYALPASIGSCIASGKKRTLVIDGDGSLQHNIQELMLINTYKLPIKLFVYNNGGYASIFVMQCNHFKSRFTACIPENGVAFPNLEVLAKAYGIAYRQIKSRKTLFSVLDDVMSDDNPVICEVMGFVEFDEIPKAMSKVNADGTMSSSALENLYPFLPDEETANNMKISQEVYK